MYGILELAERDAFLMTWYARLPAARIDLLSARDRSVPMLAEAVEAETGYRVLAFDTTMEHGIPSAWAMAVRPAGAQRPSLMTAMEDHSVLYASDDASPRLDFLTTSTQSRGFPEIRARHGVAGAFANADLTEDLTDVMRRLSSHGLEVVVVNQTTPEHRAGGFCCVKVIAPGMLPMTFGHDYRRTHGLPRLFEVPKLLGYRDRAMLPEEVNPHPHPFP
jgi:ribosomal protein S12 methylthiotransferase accessory factor